MKADKRILYFIASATPTDAEKLDAAQYDNVVYRNAKLVGSEAPEPCAAVAGLVPPQYSDRPRAKSRIDAVKDEVSQRQDKPLVAAPVVSAAPAAPVLNPPSPPSGVVNG